VVGIVVGTYTYVKPWFPAVANW